MPHQALNVRHGLRHDELCPIVALPCLGLRGMGRLPDLLHALLQLAARRRLGLERRLHVVKTPLQRLDEKTISVVPRLEASIEEASAAGMSVPRSTPPRVQTSAGSSQMWPKIYTASLAVGARTTGMARLR